MPYIKQHLRDKLDPDIKPLVDYVNSMMAGGTGMPGVLNYIITQILVQTYGGGYTQPADWSYKHINEVIGILECCKLEFYRRVGEPKENRAIAANGDIKGYE